MVKLSKPFCSSCGSQLINSKCPNKECPGLKKILEGILNGNPRICKKLKRGRFDKWI